MSTLVNILQTPAGTVSAETEAQAHEVQKEKAPAWDRGSFGDEQIRGLVRQVFFPGWPRPARYVVFSGVDAGAEVAHVCVRVAEDLARQVPAKICLVEANFRSPKLQEHISRSGPEAPLATARGTCAEGRVTIARNLCLVPAASFLGEGNSISAGWLRGRLGELRREFGYAVIHAPPAGLFNEAALLGHLCDGLILVLEAHFTRRIAARKTKEALQAANARLLGTVLDQRTFPIPEGIYRKL